MNNSELKQSLKSIGSQIDVLSKKIKTIHEYLSSPKNAQISFIEYDKNESLFNGDYLPFCGFCGFASDEIKADCNFESGEKYLKSLVFDFEKKTNEYEAFDNQLTELFSADGSDIYATMKLKDAKLKRKTNKQAFLDMINQSASKRNSKKGILAFIHKNITPEDKAKANNAIKNEINKRRAVSLATIKADTIKKYFDADPNAETDYLHWAKQTTGGYKHMNDEYFQFCGMCALLADGEKDKECIKDGMVNYHESLMNFIDDIKNTDYTSADGWESANVKSLSFLQRGIVKDSFLNADSDTIDNFYIDNARWSGLSVEQKESILYLIGKKKLPTAIIKFDTFSDSNKKDYISVSKSVALKVLDESKANSLWEKFKTSLSQISFRSHETWRDMQDLKQLDSEQDKIEAKIDPLDARVEYLVNGMGINKDDEALFDKSEDEADSKGVEIDSLEKELADIEARIQKLIKEGKNPNALSRKYDRLQRQDARKKKRETKRAVKKSLREKYGRGSDYRKNKSDIKDKIKDEKLTTLQEYGGTFGHRVVAKVGLSVVRNAYLGLVSLNAGNLGSALGELKNNHPKEYEQVLRKFYNYGGEKSNLDGAIKDGASKKPLLGIKLIKSKGADGSFVNVTGAEESTALAWVTAASSLLSVTVPIINMVLPKDKQTDIPIPTAEEQKSYDKQYILNDANLTDSEKAKLNGLIDSGYTLDDAYKQLNNKFPVWAWVGIGVATLALLGGVAYLAISSKKK